MAKLGFIGIGQMGAPMAARLVDAGHEVAVWNRTPERVAPLVERGARAASTPADAAEGAEAVVSMLATPDVLEEVAFGPDGFAGALGPGSTLIEMSTIGPAAVLAVAGRLPAGAGMIDAPVRGGPTQAEAGELTILVGGTPEAFARWQPVLAAMGTPVHVGPLGKGAALKVVANFTLGAVITTLGEALALSDGLGIDEEATLDMLTQSPVGPVLAFARSRLERGEDVASFKLSLARKDLGLAGEAADSAGLDLPIVRAAWGWLDAAERAGRGQTDYTTVVRFARERGRTKAREEHDSG